MQKLTVVLISILLLVSVNLYAQEGGLIESGDAGGETISRQPVDEVNPEGTQEYFGADTAASNPAVDDAVRDAKETANLNEKDKEAKGSNKAEDKESAKDGATDQGSALSSMSSGQGSSSISEWALKVLQINQSGNSGAAVTSIPIIVPPGRKGIEPRISLTYNSNSGNGWIGVGWGFDMGAIQRNTKWGVDYSANDYIVTANGSSSELASRGDWGTNYYGAKIEGAFSKYYYNSSTDGWEVTTNDGTKFYYGKDPI